MFIVGWKQGTNSGAMFKADIIEDFVGFYPYCCKISPNFKKVICKIHILETLVIQLFIIYYNQRTAHTFNICIRSKPLQINVRCLKISPY